MDEQIRGTLRVVNPGSGAYDLIFWPNGTDTPRVCHVATHDRLLEILKELQIEPPRPGHDKLLALDQDALDRYFPL